MLNSNQSFGMSGLEDLDDNRVDCIEAGGFVYIPAQSISGSSARFCHFVVLVSEKDGQF